MSSPVGILLNHHLKSSGNAELFSCEVLINIDTKLMTQKLYAEIRVCNFSSVVLDPRTLSFAGHGHTKVTLVRDLSHSQKRLEFEARRRAVGDV